MPIPLIKPLLVAAATAALLPLASADGQYRSRPDLAPPKLNITIPFPDINSTELVFISPYSGTIDKPGPYIYRKNGDLVWAGTGYYAGLVGNFHPTTYQGKTVLQAFEGNSNTVPGTGFGHHVLLDQSYRHVVTATAGNHRVASFHEFNVIGGSTALVEIYESVPADLTAYGGNASQQWIGNGLFQEFDIATGELVFEWSALVHIDPSESITSLTPKGGLTAASAWDYIHLNSIDKDNQGNYLLSSRHTSTIYKVNGTNGSIIWKLGGKDPSFNQVGNWTFGFQHHARWLSRTDDDDVEELSFFDNSDDGDITYNKVSSAVIVQLNHTSSEATILRRANAPYNLSARSQGNAQVLPNNHIFVNWGSSGAFTEFDENDKVQYHAFIENGESYRGFLANWTGTSTEDPAIAAFKFSSSSVKLYVSWNGDTETQSWKFYHVNTRDIKGSETRIGQVSRQSFESSFVWNGTESLSSSAGFYAEAVGRDGRVLSRTRPVKASAFVVLNS